MDGFCRGTDWVTRYYTTAAAVQRVEVGTLERAVKLSNKDAKLTKEHLRPLQVRRSVCQSGGVGFGSFAFNDTERGPE